MRDPAAIADQARSAGLRPEALPRHVAIVMDGNGRWARQRGWMRTDGHRKGGDVVRAITTESVALGIERLTLYAFSSENWTRPAAEVDFLMALLQRFLREEVPTLMDNGVRLTAIGHLHRLPDSAAAELRHVCELTAGNRNTTLCLALSYGGRDEIVDACRAIAVRVARGELEPAAIDQRLLQSHLYDPQAGDVDVVIRTAGEQRLSNFLPWQAVYAEYVSMPMMWPEFTVADYHAALREFQGRERRFGNIS